ncbi:4-hydroxy-2-oxoheptanedioate aldolase [Amycolatopsis bartoniae]|uniref:Aldolase n=1 Tax=Amycolatopsis bartoniae TaxID=941986 RepID=A0A8H9IZN3_9PSEU|nr:aldolase/citrate lyase family protein [Amycolatopsis bartoniae]MBB2939381.1 4-hydroxy-2-oxoheptanedioate aldolase [Amycolatopsis bartoniae]TVT06698.1 2-dehydro-3-deoxyglucarate aldolase [Amycolatopsis bartoniae]GHF83433.1 aldolase [Amycolatopsis bartoniae]
MTTLKQRLRSGERLLGGLLRLPSETLVEMAGVAGLDFVVFDCEHGPADLVPLQQHVVAAQAHGLGVLVRVGAAEPALVLRVLDLGADGVIAPHVDTAAQARAVVAAAHYPPLGERGFATYSRAGRFGAHSITEHLEKAEETTIVVPMIETPAGCTAVPEILSVPGVDAVLVGPADLSVAMGLTGGAAEPLVAEATQRVARAAERARKPMVSIVGSAEQAKTAPPGAVIYNLTHVLLHTLRALAAARVDS